jgi:hypothetical protein
MAIGQRLQTLMRGLQIWELAFPTSLASRSSNAAPTIWSFFSASGFSSAKACSNIFISEGALDVSSASEA